MILCMPSTSMLGYSCKSCVVFLHLVCQRPLVSGTCLDDDASVIPEVSRSYSYLKVGANTLDSDARSVTFLNKKIRWKIINYRSVFDILSASLARLRIGMIGTLIHDRYPTLHKVTRSPFDRPVLETLTL